MVCSSCILIDTALVFAAIAIGIWAYAKYKFSYWSRKGVQTKWDIPVLPFGNFNDVVFRKENFSILLKKLQNRIKEPFGGIYLMFRPVFVVKDPELIKQIIVKDFNSFSDRGFYHNDQEPLTHNLIASCGEKWRFMRTKFASSFSNKKLQEMFPVFQKINKRLHDYLDGVCRSGGDNVIEMRDLMARYSTDFITSAAYDLEVDSINDKDTLFRQIGRRIIFPKRFELIRFFLGFMIPSLVRLLNIKTTVSEIEEFFRSTYEKTIKSRKGNNKEQNDLMQHFIELNDGGNFNDNGVWDPKIDNGNAKKYTVDEMMAQMFVFFVGGHDTSSSAISFAFFELAKDKVIQKKVQDHLDEVLAKHGNKWSFECVQDMKYLDQVVDEILRMYPSVPFLMRKCMQDYKIPNSNVTIDKGTLIAISLLSLQNDHDIYPNPSIFDPDRFSPEMKASRKHYTHLPFGEGPRSCIGARLGHLQTKMGIAAVLSKYKLDLAPGRAEHINYNVDIVGLADIDGIKIKITSR